MISLNIYVSQVWLSWNGSALNLEPIWRKLVSSKVITLTIFFLSIWTNSFLGMFAAKIVNIQSSKWKLKEKIFFLFATLAVLQISMMLCIKLEKYSWMIWSKVVNKKKISPRKMRSQRMQWMMMAKRRRRTRKIKRTKMMKTKRNNKSPNQRKPISQIMTMSLRGMLEELRRSQNKCKSWVLMNLRTMIK